MTCQDCGNRTQQVPPDKDGMIYCLIHRKKFKVTHACPKWKEAQYITKKRGR